MNDDKRTRMIELAAADGQPSAGLLTPEVRSGSSFTFSGSGTDVTPTYQLVWFYTVEPGKRGDFAEAVKTYEDAAPNGPKVFYRGTYAVSISGVAPDMEFRTVWGLDSLGALGDLNSQLRAAAAGSALRGVLDLISPRPAMRSEIMGLAKLSEPL
jgi:hypothetical protein